MARKKIRVGILFGGKSAEHEVSLQSAKNVVEAIDKEKYEVVLIKIGEDGRWERNLIDLSALRACAEVDVIFPILHGPFGEDGTVQGLLKLAGVPFVGAGVLGSAVGMDKDAMKRLLRDAGIPIGKFLTFRKEKLPSPEGRGVGGEGGVRGINYASVVAQLGTPLFVKPSNLGSSVGVGKAKNEEEFGQAVAEAFRYDTKIIVEEFIEGREVECAVLGNEEPRASVVGEIIPHHESYSYEAKYLDENGAALEIPAKIPPKAAERVQELAVASFKALECEGLGRVDCFFKKDGAVLVNEINTIPGFTKISMYPQLWAASGIPYPQLIDRLITLAFERFEREHSLKVSR